MYLIEIKLGDYKIREYVPDYEVLNRLIEQNPQYEYVKIIKEVNTESKGRKR